MVNGSRQKSRMNGIAGAQEGLGEVEPLGDYDQNKYQTTKITDKDKHISVLQKELDDLTKKLGQMKRNYDSISHYSASDKAEFSKLKSLKEQYEKTISDLKVSNEAFKIESAELKT